MKRLAALVPAVCLAAVAPPAVAAGEAPYVVVLDRSVDGVGRTADRLERSGGFETRLRYAHAVKGFSARLSDAQVARLRRDPAVAFVAPDRPVRATAPLMGGDSVPTGVRRIEAGGDSGVNQASDASVAVIDTGIELSHPDLNAVDGTDCISPGTPADDGNGHGTHVAGSVAARNDGAGLVGVAPGTKVYAVRVLNSSGNGSTSTVICGIDWVTANAAALGIKVANMSLGGGGSDDGNCGATSGDPEHAAICASVAAGVTYAVAAGNSGVNLAGSTPAAYDEVLTVTAMADEDGGPGGNGNGPGCGTDEQPAGFSNFAVSGGDQGHTIAAPGVCITSTWPGSSQNTISGTSMASPHVAGAIALCLGTAGGSGPCAGLAPAGIVQKMRADAALRSGAPGPYYGFTGDPATPITGRYYGNLAWAPAATVSAGAGAVTTSGATLTGGVSPGGMAATYRFEYGTTTGYGSQTEPRGLPAGSPEQAVSEAVAGLAAGTTYHYRIVLTNAAGTSRGADRTFTTSATPPAQASAQASVPAATVLSARLLTRRAPRLGRTLRLDTGIAVACPRGRTCRGTARITAAGRRIGLLSFSVAAGSTRQVVVKLNRAGRRLFKRRRALRVRIVLELSSPTAQTVRRTARVARPRG